MPGIGNKGREGRASYPRILIYIRKYFKDKEFTQGEYSNITGEKIDRSVLKGLVKDGFLYEEPGAVIRYTYTGKEGDSR